MDRINLEGIAGLLWGLNFGLANIFGDPRFILQEQETAAMARAAANVWRHYQHVIPSPVMLDWGALASTMVGIYLPRFVPQAALAMQMAQRMKQEPEASDGKPASTGE